MKLPALCAAPCWLSWTRLALLGTACALCLGCESNSNAAKPQPAASVKAHPAFAVPRTPEMLSDTDSPALRADDTRPASVAKALDKTDWRENCKIRRPCVPQAKALPTCDAQVARRPWVDLVTEGSKVIGKEVEVSGTLGLTLLKKTGSDECAPSACCHSLEMQIVLAGEPTGSLVLRGLTCSGDDSTLCCSVPAEGQSVVARGRLQPVNAGASKWQLNGPTLCVLDNTPSH